MSDAAEHRNSLVQSGHDKWRHSWPLRSDHRPVTKSSRPHRTWLVTVSLTMSRQSADHVDGYRVEALAPHTDDSGTAGGQNQPQSDDTRSLSQTAVRFQSVVSLYVAANA